MTNKQRSRLNTIIKNAIKLWDQTTRAEALAVGSNYFQRESEEGFLFNMKGFFRQKDVVYKQVDRLSALCAKYRNDFDCDFGSSELV